MSLHAIFSLVGFAMMIHVIWMLHRRLRRVRALAIRWKQLSWGWEAPSRDPELFDIECERLHCARELLRTLGEDERAA